MLFKHMFTLTCGIALFSLAAAAFTASSEQHDDEAPFLAENSAAMDRMMTAMNITPSGDIDADFVAMMVPHHQGAIDMAIAQLRYGRNERLKRLAQEIIVTQRDEIVAMQLAVGEKVPASSSSVIEPTPAGLGTSPLSQRRHGHEGN